MTERIDVFYSRVPTPVESLIGPVYHKYLVYQDKSGKRFALRAGPDHGASPRNAVSPPADPYQESPYGLVRLQDAPLEKNKSAEYKTHPQSLEEPYLSGEDLSQTWQDIRSAFHAIGSQGYQYWPRGVNSNTIIDEALARSGNRPTYRDGTAGNLEWTAPDRRGEPIINTPGRSHLPPPPGYYELHRMPRAIGRQRSGDLRLEDLLKLPDEQFAEATHGRRWQQLWAGQ